MKFDFNESNILNQNLFSQNDTKEILLRRLFCLSETTKDLVLKRSVNTLIKKIETLSQDQVKTILSDVLNKRLVATANYDYGN